MVSKSYPKFRKTYYTKELCYCSATPADGTGEHSGGLGYYPLPYSRFYGQAEGDIWFDDFKHLPCGIYQYPKFNDIPTGAYMSLRINHKGSTYWGTPSCNSISTSKDELITNPQQEEKIYQQHLISFIKSHNLQIECSVQKDIWSGGFKLGSINQSYNNLHEHLIFICQIYNILQNYKYRADTFSKINTHYSINKSVDIVMVANQKVTLTIELLNNNTTLCCKIFFKNIKNSYNICPSNLMDELNETLCEKMPDLGPSKNYIQGSDNESKLVTNTNLASTELFQLVQDDTGVSLTSMCNLVDNLFAVNHVQILLSHKLYFKSHAQRHEFADCDKDFSHETCLYHIATSTPCTRGSNCTCPEKTGVYPIVDTSKGYTFGY